MNPIPVSWCIGGALALSAASGFAGWKIAHWQRDSAELEAVNKQTEKGKERQAKVETKATTLEKERADVIDRSPTIRIIYRDRIVPAACEPEPDAVRVLNQSRADANSRLARQPGAAVPAD